MFKCTRNVCLRVQRRLRYAVALYTETPKFRLFSFVDGVRTCMVRDSMVPTPSGRLLHTINVCIMGKSRVCIVFSAVSPCTALDSRINRSKLWHLKCGCFPFSDVTPIDTVYPDKPTL